jgi:hypothetical protein
MDAIMQRLVDAIANQQTIINRLTSKIEQLEWSHGGGGGGGSASIEDYQSGQSYTRNMLIVDPNTETVYRVLTAYTSISVADDIESGYLKLVGAESQVITFPHEPSQTEINNLPDDALVAVYSPTDTPYTPGSN